MARIDRSVRILMRIYRQKIYHFESMAKLYKEKLSLLEEETDAHRLEKNQASEQQERTGERAEGGSYSFGVVRKA